jgi:glycosyltransferase involved in cell wall biosynthesis
VNILFFTKGGASVASSRQRVWQIAEHLKTTHDISYEILHSMQYAFFSISPGRACMTFRVWHKLFFTSYDVLFVHKTLFTADTVVGIILARFLRRKKLVFDLDDAEWVHSPRKSWLLARVAHTVFCGSHAIQEWALEYTKHTVLVPTGVNARIYEQYTIPVEDRSLYTIGWTGIGPRYFREGHFHSIRSILESVAREGTPFRFVILGAGNDTRLKEYFKDALFPVVFVDTLDWGDPASVARAMHEYAFDVGLALHDDSLFNRAKCAFKIIEYMAVGVVPVASPVGENAIVIEGGVNGFLAHTEKEWVSYIASILRDKVMRERISKNAQATVRERYAFEDIIPRIWKELVGNGISTL